MLKSVSISVIIPCYNHAHFLPRAVDSVLQVRRDDVEAIIVDDGSSDNTPEVAARYGERVRYVRQENRGLAGARNTGLREAKGEFVFFLDADDEIHADTLEHLESALKSSGEGVALVACRARLVEWRNGESREVDVGFPDSPPSFEITWRDLVVGTRFPCTVMARREVFALGDCGGFDETFGSLGCEDRDMWLRIAARYRLVLLNRRLVTLHQHGSNMSGDPHRQLAGMRRLLRKARRSGVVGWWRLDFWGALNAVLHNSASIMYLEGGQPGRALLEAVASLVVYPLPVPHSLSGRPLAFRLRRLIAALKRLLRTTSAISRTTPTNA